LDLLLEGSIAYSPLLLDQVLQVLRIAIEVVCVPYVHVLDDLDELGVVAALPIVLLLDRPHELSHVLLNVLSMLLMKLDVVVEVGEEGFIFDRLVVHPVQDLVGHPHQHLRDQEHSLLPVVFPLFEEVEVGPSVLRIVLRVVPNVLGCSMFILKQLLHLPRTHSVP